MQKIKFRVLIKHPFKSLQRIVSFESVKAIDFTEQSVTIKVDGEIYKFHFSEVEFINYTGLKDTNGKEIYEGDVVRIFSNKMIVYYGTHGYDSRDLLVGGLHREIHGFYLQSPCGSWELNIAVELEKVEVIGNIYENPELLEESQNGTK